MSRRYGRKGSSGLWNIPAADRNKEPIREILSEVLPPGGDVLEIASGTGQHVVHFARAFSNIIFQPTEPDPGFRQTISQRMAVESLPNVLEPLDLDVFDRPWPVTSAGAVLCINMIHVAPWDATRALIDGAGAILGEDGVLFLYGPYRRGGVHTAPSNEAFDARLREDNPEWGIRNLEDVEKVAVSAGLTLKQVVDMPANNLSLIFSS